MNVNPYIAISLFTAAVTSYRAMAILQVQGKFYLKIDNVGEGAKWRRTVGQEIYSPLLLAFTEQVNEKSWHWFVAMGSQCSGDSFSFFQDGNNWINSHVPTFSAIDPSYALPNNIAVITLQVMGKFLMNISSKLGPVNVNEDGVVIIFFFPDIVGTFKWKSASSVGSLVWGVLICL